MSRQPSILVLDDETAILDLILYSLCPENWKPGDAAACAPCALPCTAGEFAGIRFLVCRTAQQAEVLARTEIEAGGCLSGGFFDLRLAEGVQGPDAMRQLRELQPGLPCTVVTGVQGHLDDVKAVFEPDHVDEWDFLAKPFTRAEISQRCRQMLAFTARRHREAEHLREIERLNRELQLWAHGLEQRVEERTEQLAEALRDLRLKNEELESVLLELHRTQAELVLQEKMATLGQLAAGIARELARPLSFSQQALGGIARSVDCMADFGETIDAESRPRPERSESAGTLRAEFAQAWRASRVSGASAEARNLLGHAADAISRASAIVRDLSAFATASSGSAGRVDVPATLTSAIDLVRGSLTRGEVLEADLPDLPPVTGVATELQHAWLQLLRNAVEATSDVTKPRIRITARQEQAELVVDVGDNGAGIPESLRDRVFEPFFTTSGRKVGLGLSVVHGVVTRHGGSIELTSAPAGGTTIRVRLPLPSIHACAPDAMP